MALQLKTEKDSLAEGTRNTGLNNESENSLNNGWLTDSEPYVVGSDVTERRKQSFWQETISGA